MIANRGEFRNHRCFKGEWSGFSEVKRINLIIGRNNTGKSRLLDLVEAMTGARAAFDMRFEAVFTPEVLETAFPKGVHDSTLGGDMWGDHGSQLVGASVEWSRTVDGSFSDVRVIPPERLDSRFGERSTARRLRRIQELLPKAVTHLTGRIYRHLASERDIRAESENTTLTLGPDGVGATNIVRRFILSSSPTMNHDVIERDLLSALNTVFGEDGQFTRIEVRLHDEDSPQRGLWEIFLGQEHKGLVSLTNSGSGLKTILLVLLNLLLLPTIEKKPASEFVFAFEELENNLHPSLQRRLMAYIEAFARSNSSTVFLTTHSSVILDFFGGISEVGVTHVVHDGQTASAKQISTHFERLGVLAELGARPSDLLLANGVVWVEGPSDRIYVNRWISLLSDNSLIEGRHYQCACYGGSLLATVQFADSEQASEDLVNLFRLNSNIAVICDSDRKAPTGPLKKRILRIRDEVMAIPNAFLWITEAREIENYLTRTSLQAVFESKGMTAPEQFERVLPTSLNDEHSLVGRHGFRWVDKVELAIIASPHLAIDELSDRYDWMERMEALVTTIRLWNS